MDAGDRNRLISVKKGLLRHPAVIGAGAASLVALLLLNAFAFMRGLEAPWLLGSVIVADMVVIGVGVVVAAREVLVAGNRVEATQTHLETIVDSAMDAIITVDEDQRIMLFNEAAEKIFGCSQAEVMGQSLDRFVPERFRAAHRKHIREFGEKNITRRLVGTVGDLYGLRSSGEEFPMEASISQIELSGQTFYTIILRDITDR